MTWEAHIPSFALVILVLLSIFLIGLDLWRKTPGHRWVRIICSSALLFSLYALISPIQYSKSPEKKRIIINTSQSQVPDSLMDDNTLVFEGYISWLKSEKLWLTDTLLIFGKGIEAWEISGIQQPFGYLPIPLAEGIINVGSSSFFKNIPTTISGEVFLNEALDLSIRLPDGSQQKQSLPADASSFEFELSIPMQGNLLLKFLGIRDQDTVFRENYPVFVHPAPEIKALLLTGFPTFEQKGLIEYLDQLGYAVISHQMLSGDNFRTNFYNQSSSYAFQVTSDLVKELSVLVLDPAGFETLSPYLVRVIKKQIKNGDLGLIWLGEPQEIADTFGAQTMASTDQLILKTDQGEFQLSTFQERIVGTPLKLGPYTIASATNFGFGFITHPSASDSYLLKLQGQDSLYSKFWHSILSTLIGSQATNLDIHKDPFATVDKRATLQIKSSIDRTLSLEGAQLLPLQSVLKPDWISVDYFPKSPGWQPLLRNDSVIDHIYHAPRKSWEARNSYINRKITQQASRRSQQLERPEVDFKIPVDNWWWYGIMMMSLAILWLEHRLRS